MTRKANSSISSPLRSFCLKLKRLQEASGLTQTALAKHAGLSKSQMSAILNGSITRLPDQDLIGMVVRKCMEHAAKSHRSLPIDLRREEDWNWRYNDLESDLEVVPRAPAKRGRHRLSLSDRDRTGEPVKAKQFVIGEIPREPPSFVVREALGQLAEIVGRRQVAVVCTMTGLRGVGKSQIAAAYARDRVSKGWALVGWVNAESRDALLWGLAQVAEQLGVADPGGDSLASARLLREHLNARTSQGLLVFDNATDPDVLRPFLPATGGTQVVITTTDQAFTEFGEGLDVPTFSRSESLRFLAARTSLNDEAGASEIARELGDHPLGLAQAAATIRRQRLNYPKYLARLRRIQVRDLLDRVPGGDYPRSVAAALLLSIQATEASDATGLTARLLRILAVLSPDGVRRDLLDPQAVGQPGGNAEEVDAALERCVAGSLLTWSVTGDAVIMHRLLGRVLRERDQADGQWVNTLGEALNLLEPQLFPEEQAWARRVNGTHLVAQIEALAKANAAMTGGAGFRERQLNAQSWAVRQLREAADPSRAIYIGMRVLADRKRVLGTDHPDTLTSQDNLADAYLSAGRLEDAIPLFEKTLGDRERVLGADHLDTLTSRNNLAYAYRSAGRQEDAIPLFEQSLTDCERVLGTDHSITYSAQDNLAGAYLLAGRPEDAIPLFEKTLADRERVLGVDHSDTLASQINLAYAYQSAGRPEDAILLLRKTLADSVQTLGADHPRTLLTGNNLAATYQSMGRPEQAIPLFEQTLAVREQVLGSDHPDILVSRNNLAKAYQSAGRLEQAIPLFEQTLADSERILGSDHPRTRSTRDSLKHARSEAHSY